MIQTEIMKSVKHSLNTNPEVISKISRAKDIIREVRVAQETEDRRSLNELNDYMKNYSHLTFQEYKKIKNGVKVEIDTPVDNTVVATVSNNTVKTKKK